MPVPTTSRRRILPKADREENCRVYFVEAVGTDMIKIGYAMNIDTRMRSLLTASAVPLRLVATLRGGPILEGRLHIQLAEHRAHGEWFHRCPTLNDMIDLADKPKESPPYVAKMRGTMLEAYMRELQHGRVVRPTRGPGKRTRLPGVDRYDWTPSDPHRKTP
jgi:Meiotically up-regulated gene 113